MKRSSEKDPFPDGWRQVRLGDVAEVAFSGVDKRTVDGELPVHLCNYTDVFYNRRIHVGMDLMTATAALSERDKWTLRKGDVLFTKDSETPDEIGIPSFVVDDMPGVLCGYHLGMARPRKDVVDGAFLAEALSSEESRKQFARIANGVTRFGLTLDATKALPILLPPLPEQRAIAAVLDSIDDAIEGAEAVIASTEHLRDALLHDLLTRGLPGQHAEWRDVPGLGTIPADWQVMRLGDVADVAFSSVDKKTVAGEVPVELCNYTDVFYNRRIRAGMELMTATATLSERDKWSLKTGDVLFTKDSETPDEIGIPSCVAEDMPNVLCGYHLGLARPRTDIVEGAFLADALGSSESRRQFSRIANGVTRFGLTLDATKALPILLPPLTEQRAIVAVLDGIEQALKVVQDEWEGLLLLKASTAEALLKGRVRATPLNTRSATPLVSNATSGLDRSLIKSPFLDILGGLDRSLKQSPFLDILGGLDRSLKQSPFLDILNPGRVGPLTQKSQDRAKRNLSPSACNPLRK